MLRLPGRISVQLQDVEGRPFAAPDVLIAVNVLLAGRYYYGNLVGLTGPSGLAEITRDELDLRFAADRVAYPMDYKVELTAADPLLEVILLSDQEMADARDALTGSGAVSADIRACYDKARNASFAPASTRFWADLPGTPTVRAVLTTTLR